MLSITALIPDRTKGEHSLYQKLDRFFSVHAIFIFCNMNTREDFHPMAEYMDIIMIMNDRKD